MGQNALDQSDCRIFLTIFLEQNDEKVWLFVHWFRFIEIKSWLKNIDFGVVKNECGHSGLKIVKLSVSHGGINGVSLFLEYW